MILCFCHGRVTNAGRKIIWLSNRHGAQPTSAPVARFSTAADVAGQFFFMAVAAGTAGSFILPRRAFDALNIWLKGRADRRVHLKLADGTELSASTTTEIEQLADTVERLRVGARQPSVNDQARAPSNGKAEA